MQPCLHLETKKHGPERCLVSFGLMDISQISSSIYRTDNESWIHRKLLWHGVSSSLVRLIFVEAV